MLLRLHPKLSPLGWHLHHPWTFSSAMGRGRGRAYEHHGSVRRPGLRRSPRSAHLAEVLSCQERCERAQKARHTPSQTPRMTPCCRGPSLTSLACHSGLSQPGCILSLPLPPSTAPHKSRPLGPQQLLRWLDLLYLDSLFMLFSGIPSPSSWLVNLFLILLGLAHCHILCEVLLGLLPCLQCS